jgi:hypothetical protein
MQCTAVTEELCGKSQAGSTSWGTHWSPHASKDSEVWCRVSCCSCAGMGACAPAAVLTAGDDGFDQCGVQQASQQSRDHNDTAMP